VVAARKLDVLGTWDVLGEIPAVVDPNPGPLSSMQDERWNPDGGQELADVEVG